MVVSCGRYSAVSVGVAPSPVNPARPDAGYRGDHGLGAATQRGIHAGEQLVDGDFAVAGAVEAAARVQRRGAEGDVDALQQLIDRDRAIAAAIADTGKGGQGRLNDQDGGQNDRECELVDTTSP